MIRENDRLDLEYIEKLMRKIEKNKKQKFFSEERCKYAIKEGIVGKKFRGEYLEIHINNNSYKVIQNDEKVHMYHVNKAGNRKGKIHDHYERHFTCLFHCLDSLSYRHNSIRKKIKKTKMEELYEEIKNKYKK